MSNNTDGKLIQGFESNSRSFGEECTDKYICWNGKERKKVIHF
jgi:hypothetical protein